MQRQIRNVRTFSRVDVPFVAIALFLAMCIIMLILNCLQIIIMWRISHHNYFV